MPASTKRERTHSRLLFEALRLFEKQGYDSTTTAQIAAAAGVTEMTLFRHFATKANLLGDDPYDPVMAESVALAPSDLPPIARAATGIRAAWQVIAAEDEQEIRRRIRIAATTPSLVGTMRANTAATEDAISSALVKNGTSRAEARIAAAAVLAALMQAILDWAVTSDGSLATAVEAALDVVDGSR